MAIKLDMLHWENIDETFFREKECNEIPCAVSQKDSARCEHFSMFRLTISIELIAFSVHFNTYSSEFHKSLIYSSHLLKSSARVRYIAELDWSISK